MGTCGAYIKRLSECRYRLNQNSYVELFVVMTSYVKFFPGSCLVPTEIEYKNVWARLINNTRKNKNY